MDGNLILTGTYNKHKAMRIKAMKTKKQLQADYKRTFVLPTWSLPYLVNSDPSGLTDEDIQQVDELTSRYSKFIVVDCYSDPYFSHRNDVNCLGNDVVDCVVIVG